MCCWRSVLVGKDSGQVVQAWRPLLRTSHFKIAGIIFSAGDLFVKLAGTNLMVTTFSGFLGLSILVLFCESSSSRNRLGSTPTSIWVTLSSSIRTSFVVLTTVDDGAGL
uniref:(northern house mosquito) hypothetical protein n=1 Tax=Culex pipiens TaxID=7175 RepID=A0A8D8INT9_CULPI